MNLFILVSLLAGACIASGEQKITRRVRKQEKGQSGTSLEITSEGTLGKQEKGQSGTSLVITSEGTLAPEVQQKQHAKVVRRTQHRTDVPTEKSLISSQASQVGGSEKGQMGIIEKMIGAGSVHGKQDALELSGKESRHRIEATQGVMPKANRTDRYCVSRTGKTWTKSCYDHGQCEATAGDPAGCDSACETYYQRGGPGGSPTANTDITYCRWTGSNVCGPSHNGVENGWPCDDITVTHHKAVVSWRSVQWGAYSFVAHGEQSKCFANTETTNDQGSLFVSCCTSSGSGVARDCNQVKKTYEEAVAFCTSGGNRLCTESEVLNGAIDGQGCDVDGPQNMGPSQMNMAWVGDECG